MTSKNPLYVVAALIEKEGMVFAAKRSYGELAGKWEFPGGKLEKGETLQAALRREIKEELDTVVEVGELLTRVDYEYPSFYLHMYVFVCKVKEGRLEMHEGIHSEEAFLTKKDLDKLDWCPADRLVVEKYLKG